MTPNDDVTVNVGWERSGRGIFYGTILAFTCEAEDDHRTGPPDY